MTLIDDLTTAGIPYLSATLENGIVFAPEATMEQVTAAGEIFMKYKDPARYDIYVIEKSDLQTLKDLSDTMITRLEQIQNAGAISFNQTGFNQVVQAVKDEALYIERMMKFIKRLVR